VFLENNNIITLKFEIRELNLKISKSLTYLDFVYSLCLAFSKSSVIL